MWTHQKELIERHGKVVDENEYDGDLGSSSSPENGESEGGLQARKADVSTCREVQQWRITVLAKFLLKFFMNPQHSRSLPSPATLRSVPKQSSTASDCGGGIVSYSAYICRNDSKHMRRTWATAAIASPQELSFPSMETPGKVTVLAAPLIAVMASASMGMQSNWPEGHRPAVLAYMSPSCIVVERHWIDRAGN